MRKTFWLDVNARSEATRGGFWQQETSWAMGIWSRKGSRTMPVTVYGWLTIPGSKKQLLLLSSSCGRAHRIYTSAMEGTSGTRYIAFARSPESTISFSDCDRVGEKRRTAAIDRPTSRISRVQWSPKLIIRRTKISCGKTYIQTEFEKPNIAGIV